MFNVARTPQFRLVIDNPAAHVPKPNPQNERDRIATPEEWARLEQTLAPHLRRILTVAYEFGPRKGGAAKPGMVRRGPTQEGIHVATDKEWRGSCRAYDAIGLPRLRRTMAGAKTGHESGVPV